jgi:hypothetical protein
VNSNYLLRRTNPGRGDIPARKFLADFQQLQGIKKPGKSPASDKIFGEPVIS